MSYPQTLETQELFTFDLLSDACLPYPALRLQFIIQTDAHHWGCLSWNSLGICTSNSVVLLEGDNHRRQDRAQLSAEDKAGIVLLALSSPLQQLLEDVGSSSGERISSIHNPRTKRVPEPHQSLDHQKKQLFWAGQAVCKGLPAMPQLSLWCHVLKELTAQPLPSVAPLLWGVFRPQLNCRAWQRESTQTLNWSGLVFPSETTRA